MSNSREKKKQIVGHIMSACDVENVSICSLRTDNSLDPLSLNLSKNDKSIQEKEGGVFGAASLSKTVFAYLVLKLIEKNKFDKSDFGLGKFNLPNSLLKFDLDTPIYYILPELNRSTNKEYAELITPRTILAHTTGIPHSHENGPPIFNFKPGTAYEYNGLPYFYLQIALERLTGHSLEELAKKYVFDECHMKNNPSFLKLGLTLNNALKLSANNDLFSIVANISNYPAISANSMRISAEDYMRFIKHWLNSPTLFFAFNSEISMTKDKWARDIGVPMSTLDKLGSGLGWALQKNDKGKVVRAFHWADMNNWRADVAINLENKTAVVFFADNENGHIFADHIISPEVELTHGLTYISQKLGFAVRYEKDWKSKQVEKFTDIQNYFSSGISKFLMAYSVFGQGSNTAKKLAEKSHTDKLHTSFSIQAKPPKRIK